jgi:hypothetical protein
MRPSNVKAALLHLTTIQQPVFVWGPPGVGKSDIVAQVAQERKVELRDVRLNLLDSVDLKGFPTIAKNKAQMTWLPADFLPTAGEGILFLDEMNSAPPAVQASAYQLVLNRKIGDYVLPDGWSVVAAGNRETDRSVVNRMPSALANRLTHIDFEIHLDDWCGWAVDNGVSADVIGFLRFRPDLLHMFDPNQRAFPTPRSWAFADKLINSHLDREVEFDLVKGTVGEGAASELMAFIKLARELPSTEQILLNPEGTAVPESPATLYALTTSLAMRANPNVFDRMMTYVNRMQKEFQVVFVRDATRRDEGVAKTKSFTKWGIDNTSVLV